MSNTQKLLNLAIATDGVTTGMALYEQLIRAHMADGRIRQLVRAPDGTYTAVPYVSGTSTADMLASAWVYRQPTNDALKPTVNLTPTHRTAFAVQLNAANLVACTKVQLHTIAVILEGGPGGAIAKLAGPPREYEDASHLNPNSARQVSDGSWWVLGACVLESHAQNQLRIACGVFCRTYNMGGCICGGVPRCKSMPGVVRAIVNGVEA